MKFTKYASLLMVFAILSAGCSSVAKDGQLVTTSYTGLGSPYHPTVALEKQTDFEKRAEIKKAEMLFQTRP